MKKKLKAIPSSIRQKRRYILIKSKEKNLYHEIKKECILYFGIIGLSKMSLKQVFYSNDYYIIQSDRNAMDKLIAVILLSDIDCEIIKESGTIKSLKEAAI